MNAKWYVKTHLPTTEQI